MRPITTVLFLLGLGVGVWLGCDGVTDVGERQLGPVTSWSYDNPPHPYLEEVWGSSSNDVYAVGYVGTILHYDGSGWGEMESGTNENLYGVWGSSSGDVYAVGSLGAILHYDGTGWNEMDSGHNSLWAVWGTSSSDVFVVGPQEVILHYDGTGWSEMASGTSENLRGVWGSSASDVYAVGGSNNGVILHYGVAPLSRTGKH